MTYSPIEKMKSWLNEAKENVEGNWNAMCISTIGKNGSPDSRMVLFKQFNGNKLVFFTNYQSKKGEDILANDKISIVFFWDSLGRQLRLQGIAKKTSREISENYFNSRPEGSRISAILSKQSREIKSYEDLKNQYDQMKKDYLSKSPECPDHWGGIEVDITKIEFWKEHDSRLHEREQFLRKEEGLWNKKFLSP